jgi:hypothetical protein
MGTYELVEAVATVGPVVALVGLGFVICLRSGADGPGGARGLAGNLTRTLFVLGACLLGLAAIQSLVGAPAAAAGFPSVGSAARK